MVREGVLAKVATELHRALAERAVNGATGELRPRLLAEADGWTVEDVLCTAGPADRSYAERHTCHRIVIVGAGTFQYRSSQGREVMTPGALLLGNAGQGFECSHAHGVGDRCLSFGYAPDYDERLAADAGLVAGSRRFGVLRVPPLRELMPIVSRACAGWLQPGDGPPSVLWEEVSLALAAHVGRVTAAKSRVVSSPPNAEARITRAVRLIEKRTDGPLTIEKLAKRAGLSPYHFLRTFVRVTGLTPHQYVRRARLREAAIGLATGSARVLDVALDSGFADVSTFNRAFRAEFGVNPRAYRRQSLWRSADS